MKILKKIDHATYIINTSIKEHMEYLYKNIDYSDMFGTNNEQYFNEINISIKRNKRDYKIIDKAKIRDKYTCCVDKNHNTFISNSKNYTEGHHLIPMFQQKNFDFNLDNIQNIVTLCPTCHRKVHFADDKRDILNKLYLQQQNFLNCYGIDKIDLFSIYKQKL